MVLTKAQKRLILVLLTGMFFLGISATDIYIASLPQMVVDFNSTPMMVNLTLSSYTLGIAIAVLFAGEFSNRFGRRSVLLFGVACFSIAALLIAIVPSLIMIILLRVVQSIGCAIIIIVPRLILKDCLDEREQIAANGILLMGLIISPAIAPVIGAYLAKFFGWKSCFLFSALLGFIFVAISHFALPETNLQRMTKFRDVSYYTKIYARLFTDRVFISLTIMYAAGVAVYFSFIGVSSYLYIDHWHMTPESYSTIYLWMSAAYLFGNQIMQKLNRKRLAPVKIIGVGIYSTVFGFLIILASLLVSSIHGKIIVVTFAVFFMRAANALMNPPIQIRIMNHFDDCSAQALGLNMCLGFMLNALATYMVTIFIGHPYLDLILSSGLFIVLCASGFIFNRKALAT